MFSSANRTTPSSAFSKPAIILSVVVLPQPLGPKRVKNSFFFIFNERLFKTLFSPYVLEISFNSIMF